MKKLFMFCCLLGALFAQIPSAQADFTVSLGSVQSVTNLFSYPNNCSVICFKDWTLEETAEHYLNQSLSRDGYEAQVNVTIKTALDVEAVFSGNMPDSYATAVSTFLNTGQAAFEAAQNINADQKWAFDWYFFLPHGMALQNHKTLEFLHFPPDYSLTQVQDYLNSSTTNRWNTMLEINGVASKDTPLYQTVLDLAPIGAPASAGSTLTETYSYFKDYDMAMLQNWTLNSSGQSIPVVAFGGPVRDWIKTYFGTPLSVDETLTLQLPNGNSIHVMGANHPSYIWYAGNVQGPDDTPEKAYQRGVSVMLQDAIAACWQAKMGQDPTQNPVDVKETCKDDWSSQPKEICEMYYEQVQSKTDAQAAQLCANVKEITPFETHAFKAALPDHVLTRHVTPLDLYHAQDPEKEPR